MDECFTLRKGKGEQKIFSANVTIKKARTIGPRRRRKRKQQGV